MTTPPTDGTRGDLPAVRARRRARRLPAARRRTSACSTTSSAPRRTATGTYLRWIGDDDSLEPDYVSRALEAFAEDERRVLVTTQIVYVDADGVETLDTDHDPTALSSPDPVERFAEMLRLLTSGLRAARPALRDDAARRSPCCREGTCCARTRSSPHGSRWPDPGDTSRRPSRAGVASQARRRDLSACSAFPRGIGTSERCCSAGNCPTGSPSRLWSPRSVAERAPRSPGCMAAESGTGSAGA